MTEDDLYLPAGSLICTSRGDYSDYRVDAFFVVLRPLLKSRLRELADEAKRQAEKNDNDQDAAWDAYHAAPDPKPDVPSFATDPLELFVAAMIADGLLLSVGYTEMHIGSYGELELVF